MSNLVFLDPEDPNEIPFTTSEVILNPPSL